MIYFMSKVPTTTATICAAVLAYHDKPWWMWGSFLFAAILLLTTIKGPR